MIGKVLLDINRVLFWPFIAFFLAGGFGRVHGDRGAKELPGDRVRFGANWIGVSLLGVMITVVPGTVAMLLSRQSDRFAIVAQMGMTIVVLLCLLDFPGTIIVSREGLEQRYWFRGNKRIRWSDIVEIESSPNDRMVTVKAANGTKIIHAFIYSGRSRFLQELKVHCGSELPADFPREPLGNV